MARYGFLGPPDPDVNVSVPQFSFTSPPSPPSPPQAKPNPNPTPKQTKPSRTVDEEEVPEHLKPTVEFSKSLFGAQAKQKRTAEKQRLGIELSFEDEDHDGDRAYKDIVSRHEGMFYFAEQLLAEKRQKEAAKKKSHDDMMTQLVLMPMLKLIMLIIMEAQVRVRPKKKIRRKQVEMEVEVDVNYYALERTLKAGL
ncbi:unnamed protein product [Ambrosiozyma monospora]|uniref:Unnamed protein product n=1 Tax=Ambrosiozyma monospora TaxID=43982 RepID=A0ACB5SRK8_AMBMO|nr:unnamed protein product [Ambrosiozyma monospora]